MSRPATVNEVPRAPFSILAGPQALNELTEKLGKAFRLAAGAAPDRRATLDKDPCPFCGGQVEWAKTTHDGLGYAYARCRKHPREHRWSFRQVAAAPVELFTPSIESPTPTVNKWLADTIQKLENQLKALRQVETFSQTNFTITQ